MTLNRPATKAPLPTQPKPTDDVVPEELEKKRKRNELNESTYYSTRGTHPNPASDQEELSNPRSLKNNVQTVLGVKDH